MDISEADELIPTTSSSSSTAEAIIDSSSPTSYFHFFNQLPTELRLKIWNLSLPGPRVVPIRCGPKPLYSATSSASASSPSPTSSSTSSAAATTSSNGKAPAIIGISTMASSPSTSTAISSNLPPTLHACFESRTESLRIYRPCFGLGLPSNSASASSSSLISGGHHIFLDPDNDVPYFGPRSSSSSTISPATLPSQIAPPSSTDTSILSYVSFGPASDLARVRRVALDESLFSSGLGTSTGGPGTGWAFTPHHHPNPLAPPPPVLAATVLHDLAKHVPHLQEIIVVPRRPLTSGTSRSSTNSSSSASNSSTHTTRIEPRTLPPSMMLPMMLPLALQPAVARDRLRRQAQLVMDTVARQLPEWQVPRWKVAYLDGASPDVFARSAAEEEELELQEQQQQYTGRVPQHLFTFLR